MQRDAIFDIPAGELQRRTVVGAEEPPPTEPDGWHQLIPVPDHVAVRTPFLSPDETAYVYRDRAARRIGYMVRDARKKFRPYTYGEWPDGRGEWRQKGFPVPRALYGLDRLAAKPDAPVLVVEGEKTADAASALFPTYSVVTSPHGANGADKADWLGLAGRVVVIWPDNDDEGRDYAAAVARHVNVAGAKRVAIVPVPTEFPAKWDLADPPPDGWSNDRVRDLLRQAMEGRRPFDHVVAAQNVRPPFRLSKAGVEYREETDDGEPRWMSVCSPLEILAATRDETGTEWGRLVRVTDADGAAHEWALPMTMLAGDGQAYRERLLSMGLRIAPGAKARSRLHEYIMSCVTPHRARSVSRVGWHGDCYVMPDAVFGDAPEPIILQSESALERAMQVLGALDEWQREIARHCIGNTRLVLALSVAFAAPLVQLLGEEGGGFHFRGPSSFGKTTALRVAGSAWGGGGLQGYVRTWRATGNATEAAALMHCDGLLCLDEIGEVDPREIGQIAYMLANGQGKSRARKDGSGRPPAKWRVTVLSTGEQSLADRMAEAGRAPLAGQEVRFIDIPADAGAGLGLFDALHEFPSADALARHLRGATQRLYGTAIRAFLERLLASARELLPLVGHEQRRLLEAILPKGADGQVRRVAQRFAMVGAAGWLAARLGVVPWSESEAAHAARVCFESWLESRGGAGSAEAMQAIRRVRRFIEEHGESRFARWDHAAGDRPTVRRAGFHRSDGERNLFVVFPETFKEEICAGLDSRFVARLLRDRGILLPDGDGRVTRGMRLPGFAKSARMYVLDADALLAFVV
jgi:putative DNA primase/helicase